MGKKKKQSKKDLKRRLSEQFQSTVKKSRIKECLHPKKEECSENIIKAHSIQNNKVLSKISKNGNVIMPIPKSDNPFQLTTEYGRKRATVFTGFCGHHDQMFSPIEDFDFNYEIKQVFLYIYRAFAVEYHRKMEGLKQQEEMKKFTTDSIIDYTQLGFTLAKRDMEKDKEVFDAAILNNEFNVLNYVVYEFDKEINFAATGFLTPIDDLNGNKIQSLSDYDAKMSNLYFSVFPEENKSYAIVAVLKNDELLADYVTSLKGLTQEEEKNFINYLIIKGTENLVINPDAWYALSEVDKESFNYSFAQIEDFFGMPTDKGYQIKNQGFDLFNL
ncbi:SEC-C metal-binding domain-containing protein [Globicatella sanguinis]